MRDGEEVIRDLKKAGVCLCEDMSENTYASPPLPVSRLSAGRIEEEVIPPTSRRVERGLAPLPDEHHTHARCDRRCFLRPRRPSGLPSNALVPSLKANRRRRCPTAEHVGQVNAWCRSSSDRAVGGDRSIY